MTNNTQFSIIEIPNFFEAELDKEDGWRGSFEASSEYGNREYKLSLFSRIPIVPPDIKKTGKEALSLVYNTYADSLTTDILSDVMFENPDYAPKPDDAKLLVLWKPKPSEIHITAEVIDKDPALILKYSNPYLVTTWTEPEEEPFMSFIDFFKKRNLDLFADVEKQM